MATKKKAKAKSVDWLRKRKALLDRKAKPARKSAPKRVTISEMRITQDERIELYQLREEVKALNQELERVRLLLARAITVMRANDPINARDLFGPEIMTPTQEEAQSGEARSTEAPTPEETEYPPEGVAP